MDSNMDNTTDDIIAYLKAQNKQFTVMSESEQLVIKENRSRPDLDLQQKDGGTIRKFNRKWYDTYPWLTGSVKFNKMFCLVCTSYGGEPSWGQDGIDVIKNFTNKAEKHQSSKKHIKNMELFLMVGKIRRVREKEELLVADRKKREDEDIQRREILSQIIDTIFFSIQRRKSRNETDFTEETALEELIMKRYLYDTCNFKEIYGSMHCKLMDSLESVLLADIRKEINETEFCSIQTDEVPYRESTCSVIIRYAHKGLIKERFIGLFQIRRTFDLAQIVNNFIGDARKLICHSYDGSIDLKLIRQGLKVIMPKIHFVHNYMHKLNLLLLQGLQHIKECKVFNDRIAFICNFFRVQKRAEKLRKEGVMLQCKSETLWLFHSKAVSTIIKNYKKISMVVNNIIIDRSSMNLDTINSAFCIQNVLKNDFFILLSCLFNKIFVYADHLANVIQRKINVNVDTCIQEIAQTIKNIANFKSDIIIKHCVDETKTHLKIQELPKETIDRFKNIAFSIIDEVVDSIQERFCDTKFFKFVELVVDGSRFVNYKNKYPKALIQQFAEYFHEYFNLHRLENELTMIYGDSTKRFNAYQLYSYLYDNDLADLYRETFRLLRLYFTHPLIATDFKKTSSTLTKIRNYLDHVQIVNEENSAILLYVEKYSTNSLEYISFKETVIDHFSEEKNVK